jgi:hypothetical protein
MRVDVETVELPTAPEGHEADCDCPHCLMVDMNRHLQSIGIDPRRHAWYEVPTDWGDGIKRQRIVFTMPPVAQKRSGGKRGDRWGEWKTPAEPSPLDAIADAELPTSAVAPTDRVAVRVEDIGAGVWALVAGLDRDGAPVEVSGAVVGGPDETGRPVPEPATPGETIAARIRRERTNRARTGWFAVEVRDPYADADRVVYLPAGGVVHLVDDPDDHAARTVHALAPVHGCGASLVHLYRRRTRADGTPRRDDRWHLETHRDVSPAQLAEWERGGAYVRLSAVHHTHRTISGGVR